MVLDVALDPVRCGPSSAQLSGTTVKSLLNLHMLLLTVLPRNSFNLEHRISHKFVHIERFTTDNLYYNCYRLTNASTL